jgi:hypothetical protein
MELLVLLCFFLPLAGKHFTEVLVGFSKKKEESKP